MAEKKQKTDTKQQLSPKPAAKKQPQQLFFIQKARFGSLSPNDTLQLHRIIGNQGVGQLLAGQRQNQPTRHNDSHPVEDSRRTSYPVGDSGESVKSEPAAKSGSADGILQYKADNTNTPQDTTPSTEAQGQENREAAPQIAIPPAQAFSIDDAAYRAVVVAVQAYYKTPDNDYGKQISKLLDIKYQIEEWETNRNVSSLPSECLEFINNLKSQIPAKYQAVIERGKREADRDHRQDRRQLKQYVEEGLKSDNPQYRNLCELLLGSEEDKPVLYAATPTGDSYARLDGVDEDAGLIAYFPAGKPGDAGDIFSGEEVSYRHDDLSDNTNVTFKPKTLRGWDYSGSQATITVVSPADKSRDEVLETIHHAMQRLYSKERNNLAGARRTAADYNELKLLYQQEMDKIGSNWQMTKKSESIKNRGIQKWQTMLAELRLCAYEGEYRAYFYQKDFFPSLDDKKQDVKYGGVKFSPRQIAIFNAICQEYPSIKQMWDDNPVLADSKTKFREAITAFWKPDKGFNIDNLAGVYHFFKALDALGDKEPNTKIQAFLWTQQSLVLDELEIDDAPVKAVITDMEDSKDNNQTEEALGAGEDQALQNARETLEKVLEKYNFTKEELLYFSSPHNGGEMQAKALQEIQNELRVTEGELQIAEKSLQVAEENHKKRKVQAFWGAIKKLNPEEAACILNSSAWQTKIETVLGDKTLAKVLAVLNQKAGRDQIVEQLPAIPVAIKNNVN